MQQIIRFSTSSREELVDITARVEEVVRASGVSEGICSVYARGKRGRR